MQRAFLLAVSVAVLLVPALSSPRAGWVPYFGVPLCNATESQMWPIIISDGAGGAIVAWTDYRAGLSADIYAQRISLGGNTLWTAGGVPACGDPYSQSVPAMTADGAGGAIIVWEDNRGGTRDIYGQRVDAGGAVLWGAAGTAVCGAAANQKAPAIVSDGAGGAIVAWVDLRSGVSADVYAQRVGPGGELLWAADGAAICAAPGAQTNIVLATDGAGGAIVAWEDRRAGSSVPRVYAQRVDASGGVLWTVDGLAVCPASPYMVNPAIAPDDAGGAAIVWENTWSGATAPVLLAQRVASDGGFPWGACGLSLCSDPTGQTNPVLATDAEGALLIAWQDLRGGAATPDIYVQKIDRETRLLWGSGGTAVCALEGAQSSPAIVPTADGGIVAWQDFRSGNSPEIYAQKIDEFGMAAWPEDGAVVCWVRDFQEAPVAVSDGEDGVIVAWQDFRNLVDYDVYAQRVRSSGVVTDAGDADAPQSSFLAQNVPNPFNPAALIAFGLDRPARVSLRVFDVSGRLVRTLVEGELRAGRHETVWNGTDSRGARAASGVYFYRLEAGGIVRTRKMTLLR